jgi:hypothetical protein
MVAVFPLRGIKVLSLSNPWQGLQQFAGFIYCGCAAVRALQISALETNRLPGKRQLDFLCAELIFYIYALSLSLSLQLIVKVGWENL